MDVKPTLFIGLGTSGTEIIQHFRRHIFEEFQVAALPCFSYITIETNLKNTGEDKQLPNLETMELEEKIETLHIGIPDVGTFKQSLREVGSQQRWGDLQKWIHPQLLEVAPNTFEDGAANTRMIGRLCLWYNWPDITRSIQAAFDRINHANAKDKTRQILRQYLHQKGSRENEAINISDHCDVYIVGTLCGGTCSGGFLDLGFFANYNLIGAGRIAKMKDWRYTDNSDVYGIFTVADLDTAKNRIYASNCYAALTELDYYNHDESEFNIRFPGDAHSTNLKNVSPFRWVDILSLSSSEQDVRFRGGGGIHSLHGIIGLNLFCNVVTPLMGARAAEWSNYSAQHPNFDKLNKLGHVHRLNSFGISAFWYPKHRIARGVAAKMGEQFCLRYLDGSKTGELHVEQDVKEGIEQKWNSLLDTLLYDKTLGINIRSRISETLQDHKNHLFRSKNIEYELVNIPRDNPLPKEFQVSGTFTKLIEGQIPHFRSQLESLLESLRNQVAVKPIAYTQQFFQKVHQFFQQWLQGAPSTFPQLNSLAGVGRTLHVLKQIEEDRWLRHIGLPNKVRKLLMERVLKDAEKEYIRQLEFLRDFLVRDEVEAILEQLTPSSGYETQHSVEETLTFCRDEFTSELDDACNPSNNENIKILLTIQGNDLHECMKIEIDRIFNSITEKLVDADWVRLQRSFCKKPLKEGDGEYSLYEFLRKDKTHVFDQLNSIFQREALRGMRTTNVAKLVQSSQNVPEQVLRQQCRRSSAFIEFSPHFQDAKRDFPKPIIIAADNAEDAEKIKRRSNEISDVFKKVVGTGFEHLLIFFREEPQFTLGDTALHGEKRTLYQESLQKHRGQSNGASNLHALGLHTERNTLRFDASYFLNVKILRERYNLAQELFPSEVFETINGVQRFMYEDEMLHTRFCHAENFEKEFHELAHTSQAHAREIFYQTLGEVIQALGEEEVNNRLSKVLKALLFADESNTMGHAEQGEARDKRVRVIREFLPSFGQGQSRELATY